MIIKSALLCLALNIYYEARDQPIQGQIAVGNVTMNRVKQEKESSVCKEVFKHKQFSWTNQSWKIPKKGDKNWILAKAIAKEIIDGRIRDITNGALFFNQKRLNKRNKGHKFNLGNHTFSTRLALN